MTVFLHNVIDNLTSAPLAEVDVKIRHTDALGIKKALKQEIVFDGVDIGYADTVGAQRTRSRTAPGSHGNTAALGVLHEIVDNEIIIDKAHC